MSTHVAIVELTDGTATTFEADQLFAFTGRKPSLERVNLDTTSTSPGEGRVRNTMQARDDDRVFVAGDDNGLEPIVHVAKEEVLTTGENSLRYRDGEPLAKW